MLPGELTRQSASAEIPQVNLLLNGMRLHENMRARKDTYIWGMVYEGILRILRDLHTGKFSFQSNRSRAKRRQM
jgi:hypothetical protein